MTKAAVRRCAKPIEMKHVLFRIEMKRVLFPSDQMKKRQLFHPLNRLPLGPDCGLNTDEIRSDTVGSCERMSSHGITFSSRFFNDRSPLATGRK